MVAPFILPVKLLLQDMCRQQLGWDEEMEMAEVPRSFIPLSFGTVRSCQLHNFADAIQVGYGIASYLRLESATGEVCTLRTIPRVELAAASVTACMGQKLCSELDLSLEKSVFWTDTWKYVEMQSNPADLASRGVDMDSFLASSIWITGLTFLGENEKIWPILPKDVRRGTLQDDPEVKLQLLCETIITVIPFIEEITSCFSNWKKFVHCIAWLRRFHRTLTKRLKFSVEADMTRKCLCIKEIYKGEDIWKLIQKDLFGAEKKDNLRHIDVKHPIILPSKSTAVKLMVQWKHKNLAHSGHNYLL
ncbi:uncharacterized protein [Penaeus vannamei]|uniref:uncharacterized protein n=1 Tax=Penaeus vannamei TaxID=6689 RepID=UPI00387F9AAD